MIKITFISLFKNLLNKFLNYGILKRAKEEKKKIKVNVLNLREFIEKNELIDDYSFGGGAGMVLSIPPLVRAIRFAKKENLPNESYVVMLTPQGKLLKQNII